MIEVTEEMLQVLKDYCKFYVSGADAIERIIELHEANKPKPEPYIYFKPDPFGWMVCAKDDDGAIALYEAPPTREPLSEEEIEKLVPWQGDSNDPFFSRIEFARAIEKAHRIGVNHD